MTHYALILLSPEGVINGVELIRATSKGEAEDTVRRLLAVHPVVSGYQFWTEGRRIASYRMH
jgi:hypothetical protein